MEFPPLDRRINLISLKFATVQRNSLLLYNPGGSTSREFFALEILDGAVHLSYDLGSGPVRLQTSKQVADGYFHSVTARRTGNVSFKCVSMCTWLIRWSLKVGSTESRDEINLKRLMSTICIQQMGSLHVDNCTDVENSEFCSSHSDGGSLER